MDVPDHALYYVLLTTGARIGEAIALSWRSIDLERGTITISDTIRRTSTGRYDIAPGTKTHRGRTLPLTPGCLRALTNHRERQLRARQDAPAWDIRNLVFTNDQGKPLDQAKVRRRLDRAIAKHGLPRLTPHGFRHTCATMLLVEGIHPRIVQDLLGHATTAMTMERYSHMAVGLQQSAADRLAMLVESSPDATTPSADIARNDG